MCNKSQKKMEVNTALKLEPSTYIRILSMEDGPIFPPPNSKNLPCDAWHLAGPPKQHIDPNESLLHLIKEKLPIVDFPISVGSTGYIIWPSEEELPSNGRSFDEVGRIVGIVDRMRFFQRYTGSCMLMANTAGYTEPDSFNSLSCDEKPLFIDKLNAM